MVTEGTERQSAISPDASPAVSCKLARFVHGLTYDDIPATVRERAKHLILDAVGIALAGPAASLSPDGSWPAFRVSVRAAKVRLSASGRSFPCAMRRS